MFHSFIDKCNNNNNSYFINPIDELFVDRQLDVRRQGFRPQCLGQELGVKPPIPGFKGVPPPTTLPCTLSYSRPSLSLNLIAETTMLQKTTMQLHRPFTCSWMLITARHTACCLTVAVARVRGWACQAGPRDVDASHHAGLLIWHLRVFLLLVLLAAVPNAALRRILVRAVEARLVEWDLELKAKRENYFRNLQSMTLSNYFDLNIVHLKRFLMNKSYNCVV